MKPPADRAAAQIAIPRARVRTVCVPAATMASVVGNSTAAPIPARACPVHSMPTRVFVDVPAPGTSTLTSSPITISPLPPISSRLRPNRSPSTPKVSSSRATGTRNASEIQVSWDEVGPRSCWNEPLSTAGIASPTCPTQTATDVAMTVARVSAAGRSPGSSACWTAVAPESADPVTIPGVFAATPGETRTNFR